MSKWLSVGALKTLLADLPNEAQVGFIGDDGEIVELTGLAQPEGNFQLVTGMWQGRIVRGSFEASRILDSGAYQPHQLMRETAPRRIAVVLK